MIGGMQHWPLRITRLLDHGERERGTRKHLDVLRQFQNDDIERPNLLGIERVAAMREEARHPPKHLPRA